jgi:hypothetical protein
VTTTTARTRRPRQSSRFESARFLTIDLDVRSRRSLAPLIAAWPTSYRPYAANGQLSTQWLIFRPEREVRTAEAAAKELLARIGALRGAARTAWRSAHHRLFDVGVRAGGEPGRPFEELRLSAETLRRIAVAGAQLQVTVYPAELESSSVPTDRRRKDDA